VTRFGLLDGCRLRGSNAAAWPSRCAHLRIA
jgi:hypothetical protein